MPKVHHSTLSSQNKCNYLRENENYCPNTPWKAKTKLTIPFTSYLYKKGTQLALRFQTQQRKNIRQRKWPLFCPDKGTKKN